MFLLWFCFRCGWNRPVHQHGKDCLLWNSWGKSHQKICLMCTMYTQNPRSNLSAHAHCSLKDLKSVLWAVLLRWMKIERSQTMNEDYWCHLKIVNVYLLCDYCGALICVSWIVVHVVPLMLATVNYTQLQIFYIEKKNSIWKLK